MAENNSLVDFYKTGKSMPQLNAGVYVVTLKSHKLVENAQKDKQQNPYIALEFETDSGRILKENRFNKGFQIFVSHLKQQLNRGDEEIGVLEFLDQLIEEKTKITLWVVKNTPANGGQTRTNFNFLEPRKKTDTGVSETNPDAKEETIEDAIE